jgi:hypothetical protein
MSYVILSHATELDPKETYHMEIAARQSHSTAMLSDKTRQDSTRQGTFLSNSPEFRGGGRDVARTVWITSPEHVAIPWCRQVEDVRVGHGLALPPCYVCTVSTVKELTELSLCFSNSVPLNKKPPSTLLQVTTRRSPSHLGRWSPSQSTFASHPEHSNHMPSKCPIGFVCWKTSTKKCRDAGPCTCNTWVRSSWNVGSGCAAQTLRCCDVAFK